MIQTKTIANTLKYITLLIGVFVVLFPPYVVIVNSFKADEEYNTGSTMALPESFFNFDNFKAVFERGGLINGFANTLIIICITLVFNILFGTMVAYVLGRFDFRIKSNLRSLPFRYGYSGNHHSGRHVRNHQVAWPVQYDGGAYRVIHRCGCNTNHSVFAIYSQHPG